MASVTQKEIHELAKEKGWWDGWSDPAKRIPESIALAHSELSEALEEYRKGIPPTEVYFETDGKPCGFGIELADVVIRLRDTAEALGFDLEELIAIKHLFNKTRPFRHGGKKA